MTSDKKQYDLMTRSKLRPLIMKMAVPTIISMVVTAIYNIGDTYFVSQLGTSASGAVGVIFPLMAIIQAIGFTVGMGSGSICSRVLGEKDKERADRTAASAFVMSIVFGVILTVAGSVVINDLVMLLGATPTIKPYAVSYCRYILLGAPIMTGSYVLNNLLRAQGKAKLAMFGIASGGILNLALDPLFIFTFGMGTAGAAIATIISQAVGFVILLLPFIMGKSIVSLSMRCVSRAVSDYLYVLKCGMPSFFRQGLASVATVMLNRAARGYEDSAVAAMSIVGKIFMIMFAVGLGIGQGYMPVLGYNYGAKKYSRCREAFRFTFIMGAIIMTTFGAIMFIFAPEVMTAFRRDDPDVIRIGTQALRAQCLSMPLLSLGVTCNMTFQTIGRSWLATLLSSLRQGIFFLPLIIILPRILGLDGVTYTQAIADVLTFIFCVPFALSFIRSLPKSDEPDEIAQ